MKHFVYCSLVLCLLASCSGRPAKLSSSASSLDSASYAIGVLEGIYMRDWFKTININVNQDYLYKGMEDALLQRDTITKLDRQWAEKTINQYLINQKKEKSRLFLEKNKQNDSVQVRESGLQYKVITEGTGISPSISDTIIVKYKGTLSSGDLFDATTEPIKVPLQKMIAGWKEGLPLMKEGAKYIFYLPSDLAYGDYHRQFGGEAMVFEVELVSVIKGAE